MQKYLVSGHTQRATVTGNSRTIHIEHNPFVVEAVSDSEAIGKAYQILLKVFPDTDGWSHHHVKVLALESATVVTVEGCCRNK